MDRARTRRWAPLAILVAAAALAGCGAPPDRTDPAATAVPDSPIGVPGAGTRCAATERTEGDPKLEPDPASMTAAFAAPEALEGFDVLCGLTWTEQMNGCEMTFSHAYLDGGADGARLDEIDAALEAWAQAEGLEPTRYEVGGNERSWTIPHDPDPALATLLGWAPVSRFDGAAGVQRHADLAGIPLDGADVRVLWSVCPEMQGWTAPP